MHDESPGFVLIFLGGVTETHPFAGGHMAGKTIVFHPQFFPEDTAPVQIACDTQGFGQLARSGSLHTGPDQHRLGIFHIAGDDVQHPMDAVAQIDIDGSSVGVEDFCSLGAALVGVAGGVILAAVGFRFRDTQTAFRTVRHPVYQYFAHQILRHF